VAERALPAAGGRDAEDRLGREAVPVRRGRRRRGRRAALRGPNVFPGYWRNPDATAETLAGGWLHTGDVVERDDEGYFYVKGRVKEMFISGGENVYPAEVESVLHDHAQVHDAAVVGVPDGTWGEVGIAFVVADAGVTEEELIAFCRDRLARFKVPKGVRFVDSLPRNSMGKLQKSELAVEA